MMSERSSHWSLEEAPLQYHTCACCGEAFQLATGAISDGEGADLALYLANLSLVKGHREVRLFLRFKAKNRGKTADLVVSLVLGMDQGQVVTSVVTDEANPLGHAMSQKQALASPFRPLIFEIADFIVENDTHVRPYLDAGRTSHGR
jgi:hypothetical protein